MEKVALLLHMIGWWFISIIKVDLISYLVSGYHPFTIIQGINFQEKRI